MTIKRFYIIVQVGLGYTVCITYELAIFLTLPETPEIMFENVLYLCLYHHTV